MGEPIHCLQGVALASQLLCPSSMLFWTSFQQGVWRWRHYKFEGVEGTHLVWGCDSNFFINNYYKLVGDTEFLWDCDLDMHSNCRYTPSSTTRPKYMEGIHRCLRYCNCCASFSESMPKYTSVNCCGCIFSNLYWGGCTHPQ